MLQQHTNLLPFNTFGLEAYTDHFAEVQDIQALKAAIRAGIRPVKVLGGGSNVLLTQDQPGLIIRNAMRGIVEVRRFKNKVWVAVEGGHNWHDFVLWAVSNGYGGVENLSLIPGTVGASPVQNIGAYGVELKDVFVKLTAVDLEKGGIHHFNHAACQFGYRDSIFKRAAKGQYCITTVVFSLTLPGHHRIHTNYGDVQRTLADMGVQGTPGIAKISEAVVRIRRSKLPDPAEIGNCGSFFKNPEVPRSVLESVQQHYPQVPSFDLPDNRVKIPAGWLIEQCGWKGKRVGNTGSYEKQALVLVNYGGAKGLEVKQLAMDIIESVRVRFGIDLEPEVNIW